MAYFNGKQVFFSPKVVVEGIDKGTLETALNEKTEKISAYTPVSLIDVSYAQSWLSHGAVVVTEDMVENGLFMMRIAEGTQDSSLYLISGQDVDHLYNEQTMTLPQMGEVGKNLIEYHGLSAGYIIAKEQSFECDGCIFVTPFSFEGVTKENLDNILTNM